MADRSHKVAFAAIDKRRAASANVSDKDEFVANGKLNLWKLGAFHLLLSLQKYHQSHERKKGHTVAVFDQGSSPEAIAELVLNPPAWTDSFYDYKRSLQKRRKPAPNPEAPLNMIVDAPYFADSRHVGMLQIADLFSYLLRHHAELQSQYTAPKYSGECEKVAGWVSRIAEILVPDNFRWKASGGCDCNKFFRVIAPEPLLDLHRRPPAAQNNTQC